MFAPVFWLASANIATELPWNLRCCRKAAQDATIAEDSKRLEELSQMVAQLASKQETVLRDQLEAVRRRHVQLCQQLLHVLRYVSARGWASYRGVDGGTLQ